MRNFLRICALIAMAALLLCGCQETAGDHNTAPGADPTTVPSTQLTIPTAAPTQPADDGKVTYTVTVLDQNSNPVSNVTIQFCDDQNCKMPVATDAAGVVSVAYAESEYHVTLTQLPEGYSSEKTVFYFDGTNALTIVVKAD